MLIISKKRAHNFIQLWVGRVHLISYNKYTLKFSDIIRSR